MKSSLKINLLTELKDGPWGGGHQFLKNLKRKFINHGVYTDNPADADIILFNSYQELLPATLLKIRYPAKRFIHRLGPIFHHHRGHRWRFLDRLTIMASAHLADLAVFQSNWSLLESRRLGFKKTPAVIIPNAPDNNIFHPSNSKKNNPEQKIELISASWSSNPNKGLEFFSFLDAHLDFSKFNLSLIGNFPASFKNIKIIPPLSQTELAEHLRSSDIFIAPFKHEACSNAILEALACGLPIIALLSGGNHELVQAGGEMFSHQEELLAKINLVSKRLSDYQDQIKIMNLARASEIYLQAAAGIASLPTKTVGRFFLWKLKLMLKIFKLYRKL